MTTSLRGTDLESWIIQTCRPLNKVKWTSFKLTTLNTVTRELHSLSSDKNASKRDGFCSLIIERNLNFEVTFGVFSGGLHRYSAESDCRESDCHSFGSMKWNFIEIQWDSNRYPRLKMNFIWTFSCGEDKKYALPQLHSQLVRGSQESDSLVEIMHTICRSKPHKRERCASYGHWLRYRSCTTVVFDRLNSQRENRKFRQGCVHKRQRKRKTKLKKEEAESLFNCALLTSRLDVV